MRCFNTTVAIQRMLGSPVLVSLANMHILYILATTYCFCLIPAICTCIAFDYMYVYKDAILVS